MNGVGAAPALEGAGIVLSRSALADAVARARASLAAPADDGARFALLADNGIDWAIGSLALHESRAPNVPLPQWFTNTQLRQVLDQAGVDVVLTDDPARVLALDLAFTLAGVLPASGLMRLRRASSDARRPSLPRGTTKVTFTSGSTGTPKGVCLSAAALEAVAASLAEVTRPLGARRHRSLLPLATLLEDVASLLAAPRAGACSVLPPLRETGVGFGGLDVPALLGCIARHQPESMILVPELLRVLVAAAARGWRAPDSLRFIAVGGAAVAASLLERAAALGLPVYEGYGLSECGSVVALNAPGAERRGSAGRVLPHARVRIDAAGEVRVGGAGFLGYLGDAASCEAASGEVATGDLGELDAEGFLHIRGRAKNLLITSLGRNVSPEWVERELLADAAIGQAVAIGEARPFLAALLVASRPEVTDAQLAAAVAAANARLPEHARLRRWARLREPLSFADGSLTANGRVRREVVVQRHASLLDSIYGQAIAS